jgi:hypothetical protein
MDAEPISWCSPSRQARIQVSAALFYRDLASPQKIASRQVASVGIEDIQQGVTRANANPVLRHRGRRRHEQYDYQEVVKLVRRW